MNLPKFVLISLLALSACNSPPSPESPKKVSAPSTGGVTTIKGEVRFDGILPPEGKNPAGGTPECVKENPENHNRRAIVTNGKLKNGFVYLKEGVTGTYPPPSTPVILDQHSCSYLPRVLGMQVGQPLEIRNSDSFLHNVHSKSKNSANFNIGMPMKGMKQQRTFDHPEVMVIMRCDVHGWMMAFIGVLPHPYFAVSGDDGSFQISNVPAGTYTVEAWHELFGTQSKSLTLSANHPGALEFIFKNSSAN